MRTDSLRKKIITFVITIITPIIICTIVSLIISKDISNNYRLMLDKLNEVNDVKNILSDSFNEFNLYFQSSDESDKVTFSNLCDNAIDKIIELEESSDIDSRYVIRDLQNTVRSYAKQGEKTIEVFDSLGAVDSYYTEYVLAKENSSYCDSYVTKLTESYIEYNNKVYYESKEKEKKLYILMIAYIVLSLILSSSYTVVFLKRILGEINALVVASKNVSQGDFTEGIEEKSGIYEIQILYRAYNIMISDIKKHIDAIEEKLQLESELKEDEVKLLKYENNMKQIQLKVLQSQINPHFLFNTLNCITQTAIKENAYETEELIKSVSSLLRYSLSRMERKSTVMEEIAVVEQYIFIQKTRFEDRLTFSLKINCDISQYKVPAMTIQPLVENAFIHGIEPMEEGGDISIIINENMGCDIYIKDSGCGIEESILKKIKEEDSKENHKGHTTGLGIKSVIKRLEILYGDKFKFDINSSVGHGTTIFLHIPLGDENDVKDINCR